MSEDTKQMMTATLAIITFLLSLIFAIYDHNEGLLEIQKLKIEKGGIECSET